MTVEVAVVRESQRPCREWRRGLEGKMNSQHGHIREEQIQMLNELEEVEVGVFG